VLTDKLIRPVVLSVAVWVVLQVGTLLLQAMLGEAHGEMALGVGAREGAHKDAIMLDSPALGLPDGGGGLG
jgi:hypothetical protein